MMYEMGNARKLKEIKVVECASEKGLCLCTQFFSGRNNTILHH